MDHPCGQKWQDCHRRRSAKNAITISFVYRLNYLDDRFAKVSCQQMNGDVGPRGPATCPFGPGQVVVAIEHYDVPKSSGRSGGSLSPSTFLIYGVDVCHPNIMDMQDVTRGCGPEAG
jgi:hypothetical protein